MTSILYFMKPKFEERTIIIKVAICPKCGHDLEVVTDPDLKTMMTYRCNYCDYRY